MEYLWTIVPFAFFWLCGAVIEAKTGFFARVFFKLEK